jgi:hypothetical protein
MLVIRIVVVVIVCSWIYHYLCNQCLYFFYITTVIVNLNPIHGEVFLIQHYMIKFISDLWQVGGFLQK